MASGRSWPFFGLRRYSAALVFLMGDVQEKTKNQSGGIAPQSKLCRVICKALRGLSGVDR
jgi:hypothetical protein